MSPVVIGNLFSVLATGADLWGASRKSARAMLWAQTVSQGFLGISSLVLGGYSAVVQNVVSMIRNLTALREKTSQWIEYLLVALGVVLGIVCNNLGVIGWLPVVANLEYSIAVFRLKHNERLLKAAFALCIVLYIIFNLAICNYVGAVSNVAVLITTVVSICKTGTGSRNKE